MTCLFCDLINGVLPCDPVYRDEQVLVLRDIAPQAPTHLLVAPIEHVESLWDLEDEALAGKLLATAARMAREAQLADGWRLIVNTRHHGGQEVPHVHLHVIGGRPLGRMLPLD
ncbi:MAG TPA: HIT domain-containing protein [Planctomycetota bacterium]|jgi:histidine triad (HIT) family protein|nr:HIT domain-containing protein [Planctomycetota bacterium]